MSRATPSSTLILTLALLGPLGCSAPGGEEPGGSLGGAAPLPGEGTGGGSNGSGGAASGSGGAPSGSLCDRPGVIFCEDFEGHPAGAFPGAPWREIAIGDEGSIVVDDESPAKSGAHSVKVSSAGDYQRFFSLTEAPVFSDTNSALYVRVSIRLSEPMTGGHNTYFKAGAEGASSSENETRVGVMYEMLMINQPDGDRGFLSNENYWTDRLPGAVIPKDTWTCIEAFFDPPHSTVSIALDGVDIPDLHVTDWEQDTLGALHFGFEQYAGPEAVLWYDDIVVSTAPIGCN